MIFPEFSWREEETESSQSVISAFLPCPHCCVAEKMAANSMGAFAAFKVRDKINNSSNKSDEKPGSSQSSAKMSVTQTDCPDNPTKYSSKAMMAIWGMYNRYSVHNFKSNGNSYDHKA